MEQEVDPEYLPPPEMAEVQPVKREMTVNEAIQQVAVLVGTPLQPVDQRDLGPTHLILHHSANFDAKLQDHLGFNTGIKRFQDLADARSKLLVFLEGGEKFAALLYTWRCCSMAIPAIKSHDQSNRMDIYNRTLEVMDPQISQLNQLMGFQQASVGLFISEIKRLCQNEVRGEYVPEDYLMALSQFINMFATLDELKNIKASIKNDYSTYRRAVEMVRKTSDPKVIQEAQAMTMFLGTHYIFRSKIKEQIQAIPGYEDILCEVINVSLHSYEQGTFLTPNNKHNLVKSIGYTLFLLDGLEINMNRMDAKKRINISKIDKLFKHMEVVPLYGDMMVTPFSYIRASKNYDESKWPHCTSASGSNQAQIKGKIADIKSHHDRLLCDLTSQTFTNAYFYQKNSEKQIEDESRELYNMALVTLQSLAQWTAKVMEMFSWKLAHPTDYLDNSECPRDAEEYERATKYNFSKDDKHALGELISCIKGVQGIMLKMESKFVAAIRRHVYSQLQDFVQVQLREPLRKAVKHKREAIKTLLHAVRDIAADWAQGVNPATDPILQGKKDPESRIIVPKKISAPAHTQLHLVRYILASLVEKSSGKKSLRKDLDVPHVQAIENFLKVSTYWPLLIDFPETLQSCCDLSQLWYREFYLEMTQSKRIQFPIDMSLPWMITDHILDTKNAAMMDCVLYLLDLYNDSAWCALKLFKKQYLYEEIEAEINLCFDQLVYKLSEQIFAYYKHLASSIYLDKGLQWQCKRNGLKINQPPIARYENILKQTDVQLLGRSINLQELIAQRINAAILKSLDVAISRFESGDITAVMELVGLTGINRVCHQLLSEYLPLDNFDSMFREADRSVTAPYGRLTLHLFMEIHEDFLPHYCYNAATTRFVRTSLEFREKLERDKPPSVAHPYLWGTRSLGVCFAAIYNQYSNFVGPPHFSAMCQLLGYQDITIILRELLQIVDNLLNVSLVPYMDALMAVMPKRCIQPRYDYGSPGVLAYYQVQLNDIMLYSDLQPKVFQALRELGNLIIFSLNLSQALTQEESSEHKQGILFHNNIPRPFIPNKGEKTKEERDAEIKQILKKLEAKYKYQQIEPILKQYGTKDQESIAKENILLTREKLCFGLSIFEVILTKIHSYLRTHHWKTDKSPAGAINLADSTEFHRLWSALQFVFCIPPRSANEHTIEQLFGEGLNWAGCTLVTLLGQRQRFEVMDFSYHLLKVNRVDQKDEVCKGIALKKMMDRIRKFQILNYQVFSIIEKYTNQLPIMEPHIQHIDPPEPEMNDYETVQNIKPKSKTEAEEQNNNDEDSKPRISIRDYQDEADADYDDEDFPDENLGESEA